MSQYPSEKTRNMAYFRQSISNIVAQFDCPMILDQL